MASNFSLNFNYNGQSIVRRLIIKSQLNKLAKEILKEIKKNTAGGVTSVAGGKRKFPGYKNPKRYPGALKNKKPVNLKLTGDMLKALTTQVVIDKGGFEFSYFFKDLEQTEKYVTHHYGYNKVPVRKILPIDDDEKFSTKIITVFKKGIKRIIGKGVRRINQGGN